MNRIASILVIILLVLLGGGMVLLAAVDVPAPVKTVEKVIPDARLPH